MVCKKIKKMDIININVMKMIWRLKYEIVSGWLIVIMIVMRFRIINNNKINFFI